MTGWHQGALPEGAAGDFCCPGTPNYYTPEFRIRQLQEKHQTGEVAGELEAGNIPTTFISCPCSTKTNTFPQSTSVSSRWGNVFQWKNIPCDQILHKVNSGPSKINLGSLKVGRPQGPGNFLFVLTNNLFVFTWGNSRWLWLSSGFSCKNRRAENSKLWT